MKRNEQQRRRAKHRLTHHVDWKNGVLKELLGVSSSREIRKRHIDDFFTLEPYQEVLVKFDGPPWSTKDLRQIRARMRLRGEFFPF
jgi:hypothetical protein